MQLREGLLDLEEREVGIPVRVEHGFLHRRDGLGERWPRPLVRVEPGDARAIGTDEHLLALDPRLVPGQRLDLGTNGHAGLPCVLACTSESDSTKHRSGGIARYAPAPSSMTSNGSPLACTVCPPRSIWYSTSSPLKVCVLTVHATTFTPVSGRVADSVTFSGRKPKPILTPGRAQSGTAQVRLPHWVSTPLAVAMPSSTFVRPRKRAANEDDGAW